MADQWVRLGMALVLIALVSISLHAFSSRARAVEPSLAGVVYRP